MTSPISLQPNHGEQAQGIAEAPNLIDDLLHQLVGLLGQQEGVCEDRNNCPSEAIILDRTVADVRYVLIRMVAVIPNHAPLSPREQEIVRMVANGHPTKVIAGVLNISCWTVTAHLRRIFTKLGVTSRPAMIARLVEDGRKWDVPVQGKPLSNTQEVAGPPSQLPGEVPRSRTTRA
jgi:DNA-binding CsgD family transcriptional regulator